MGLDADNGGVDALGSTYGVNRCSPAAPNAGSMGLGETMPPFETGLLEVEAPPAAATAAAADPPDAMADVKSPKGLGNPGHKAGGTRP